MIQINLFTSTKGRIPFTKLALDQFSKINSVYKEQVNLHLYCNSSMKDIWMEEFSQEKYQEFDISLRLMPDDEYIKKPRLAQQTSAEYSCKWDEDVLLGTPTWEYLISKIDLFERDPSLSVLAPQLSNGIPTVDNFMRDFLTYDERMEANQIFLKEGMKNVLDIWGADYRPVQLFIENMNEWDETAYWAFVSTFNPKESRPWLPDNYKWAKGVHPARFSYKFNMFIADKILNNKDKIFGKNDFFVEAKDTVYFCNNIFFSTTKYWKDSLSILYDGYDEGQLTIFAKQRGMRPAYIRNSFGIHMAYGCTDRQKEIEDYYIKHLC